jgi:hypothetical protein
MMQLANRLHLTMVASAFSEEIGIFFRAQVPRINKQSNKRLFGKLWKAFFTMWDVG